MTNKQKLFVAEYLVNDFNATDAAKAAGYSERSAYQIGYELILKQDIRKAIQEHVDSTIKGKKDILKKQIIDKLCFIAFEDLESLDKDKLRALELLGKFMAMFTEKTETLHKTIDDDGNETGFQLVDPPGKGP